MPDLSLAREHVSVQTLGNPGRGPRAVGVSYVRYFEGGRAPNVGVPILPLLEHPDLPGRQSAPGRAYELLPICLKASVKDGEQYIKPHDSPATL